MHRAATAPTRRTRPVAAVAALPRAVAPMLATPGPMPTGDRWAFEWKWDGMRGVVAVAGGRIRIVSRAMNDWTTAYPELADLAVLLGRRRVVLDGEIVATDSGARPSFALLQHRMQRRKPARHLTDAVPVRFHAFDVLHLDGQDTTRLPYVERRDLLAGLGLVDGVATVPPHLTGVNGDDVLEAARVYGLEGVVAKRLDSTYRPGERSRAWVKVPLNHTQDVTVVGYTGFGRHHPGMVGSLLVAIPDAAGTLVYAGHVGTGFTHDARRDLYRRLVPLRRRGCVVTGVPGEYARWARWVEPVVVGEVAYRSWTADGVMRIVSWRGLRHDLPARWRRPAVRADTAVVEGCMVTPDGRWRVEAVRQGRDRWYRLRHGDNTVEGLAIGDVERLLGRAGVNLVALRETPAA